MKVNKFLLNLFKYTCEKGDAKRIKDYHLDPKYNILSNISYIDDSNPLHKFDILYAPANTNKKNCCIIDIHGGAYIFGKRINNHRFASYFCDQGFDVIVIDYIPNDGTRSNLNIIKECLDAISYIKLHLKELNLSDNFVITGDSAGGHLALICSEAICDKDLATKLTSKDIFINLKACLVNCPTFDYYNLGKGSLSKSGLKRMLGLDAFDLDTRKLIDPKTNIDSLKVPLFVSTCTNDFIKNESIILNEVMQGKPNYQFIDLQSSKKEVGHVHNVINPHLEESVYINNQMVEFINKYI